MSSKAKVALVTHDWKGRQVGDLEQTTEQLVCWKLAQAVQVEALGRE